VNAPEPQPFAGAGDQVAALNVDEAGFAGGGVQQEGHIGNRRAAGPVVHHVGLQQAVVPLGEGANGQDPAERYRPSKESFHGERSE
jgi:hypothetical protein